MKIKASKYSSISASCITASDLMGIEMKAFYPKIDSTPDPDKAVLADKGSFATKDCIFRQNGACYKCASTSVCVYTACNTNT
ncbi:hypothetical protein [Xenorhabdus poinarii]|uniref:hypothetical protein n=1 Tax=Xenorhabdus poinarii TaxID=40577 RepID=UPI0005FA5AEC|nr:hypothetical protein [Xenorhabdus poinarii]